MPPPKTSPESFNITRLYGPFTRRVPLFVVELLAQCRRSQLGVRRQQVWQLLRAGRLEAYEPQDLDACFVKLLAQGDLAIGH